MPQVQIAPHPGSLVEAPSQQRPAALFDSTGIANRPQYPSAPSTKELAHEMTQDLNTIERIAKVFAAR
ncbi:hypothetical protein LshimejAT787_1003900 [Lyophyllum shimeji]|uniref:Uncharacterized protein n=1 Tax=Lyophyllum shimeji TaxID=47721 RepID=A0A9P3PS69_LYOSH|nr:hypothetical protein LshimejAT787_1003900 [Lyophyllum shimeji]